MKTVHWTIIAAILTAVWLGFMIYMSVDAYEHKDPKPISDFYSTYNSDRK